MDHAKEAADSLARADGMYGEARPADSAQILALIGIGHALLALHGTAASMLAAAVEPDSPPDLSLSGLAEILAPISDPLGEIADEVKRQAVTR